MNQDNAKSTKLAAPQRQPWEVPPPTPFTKLISKTSKEEDFNFHLHLTKQGEEP